MGDAEGCTLPATLLHSASSQSPFSVGSTLHNDPCAEISLGHSCDRGFRVHPLDYPLFSRLWTKGTKAAAPAEK